MLHGAGAAGDSGGGRRGGRRYFLPKLRWASHNDPCTLLTYRGNAGSTGGQAEAAVAAAMELLEQGARSRTTAANGVHDASSRSHAIITLRLRVGAARPGARDTEAIVSLVDLAGSERASETKQVTAQQLCARAAQGSGLLADTSDAVSPCSASAYLADGLTG